MFSIYSVFSETTHKLRGLANSNKKDRVFTDEKGEPVRRGERGARGAVWRAVFHISFYWARQGKASNIPAQLGPRLPSADTLISLPFPSL